MCLEWFAACQHAQSPLEKDTDSAVCCGDGEARLERTFLFQLVLEKRCISLVVKEGWHGKEDSY